VTAGIQHPRSGGVFDPDEQIATGLLSRHTTSVRVRRKLASPKFLN
jgi:hypothetical protein